MEPAHRKYGQRRAELHCASPSTSSVVRIENFPALFPLGPLALLGFHTPQRLGLGVENLPAPSGDITPSGLLSHLVGQLAAPVIVLGILDGLASSSIDKVQDAHNSNHSVVRVHRVPHKIKIQSESSAWSCSSGKSNSSGAQAGCKLGGYLRCAVFRPGVTRKSGTQGGNAHALAQSEEASKLHGL